MVGGQSGNLGTGQVFNATPDGYTLLASQPAPITTAPLLFKSLPYDPSKLEPVAMMSAIANTLLVRKDFPANTVQEFIAYVKGQSGQGQLRLAGQWHHLAPHRRDVRLSRRNKDEPHSLSRHGRLR